MSMTSGVVTDHRSFTESQKFNRLAAEAESMLRDIIASAETQWMEMPARDVPCNGLYHRRVVEKHDAHELATMYWLKNSASTLHGHSDSAVLLRVLSGRMLEERYIPQPDGSYRYEVRTFHAGEESYLASGTFHRIHCMEEAETVHAFLPTPSDPTSPVPAEVMPLLAAAKATYNRELAAAITKSETKAPSLRTTINTFADVWAKREADQNNTGAACVSPETIQDWRDAKLFLAPVPIELGGWGNSLTEVADAVRQLARNAPSTALAIAMPLGNAATTRIPVDALSDECATALLIGRQWIADQIADGKILAVANSEPGAGGDLAQTKTTAASQPDGSYHLTGKKSFATLGPAADFFLCAAKRPGTPGKDVVDGYFVARTAAGVTLDERWNPLGMRPTASVGIQLENAPAAAVLGFPGCLEGVNSRHWSTILFAAVFVGIAEGALNAGIKGMDAAGAASAYVRSTFAKCMLDIEAAAGLLEAVAADERLPLPSANKERCNRAKTFAARIAVETATHVSMISGGRAYRADHHVSQMLHDALAGPLLRPPFAKAMDAIADKLMPTA